MILNHDNQPKIVNVLYRDIQYKCTVMEYVINDFIKNEKKENFTETLNSILLLKKNARDLFSSLQGPRKDLRSQFFFLFV